MKRLHRAVWEMYWRCMGEWKPLTSMKQHLSLLLTSPSTHCHGGSPGTALANLAHRCNKQESEFIKQMRLPKSKNTLTTLMSTILRNLGHQFPPHISSTEDISSLRHWFPGTLVPWFSRTLAPQDIGSLGHQFPRTLVPQDIGSLGHQSLRTLVSYIEIHKYIKYQIYIANNWEMVGECTGFLRGTNVLGN